VLDDVPRAPGVPRVDARAARRRARGEPDRRATGDRREGQAGARPHAGDPLTDRAPTPARYTRRVIRTRIAGLGRHVPERILTNADLERMVETSDEWIINRTGIRERRIAAPHETTSTLATAAARRALADANIAAEDLDLVICATTTPDGLFPSVASLVQEAIGARRAGAFDINAACMGFLSALATASQFIAAGSAQRVLVVGAETLSRIVDWTDRSTCVLFGDGAGALVLEAAERGGPLGFVLHSDGGKRDALYAEGPCGPRDDAGKGPLDCFIRMDGPAIFKFAVHAMTEAVRETLATARVGSDDIDVLVP